MSQFRQNSDVSFSKRWHIHAQNPKKALREEGSRRQQAIAMTGDSWGSKRSTANRKPVIMTCPGFAMIQCHLIPTRFLCRAQLQFITHNQPLFTLLPQPVEVPIHAQSTHVISCFELRYLCFSPHIRKPSCMQNHKIWWGQSWWSCNTQAGLLTASLDYRKTTMPTNLVIWIISRTRFWLWWRPRQSWTSEQPGKHILPEIGTRAH